MILNYIDYAIATNQRCFAPTGELDYCTPRVYRPAVAHLFHNNHGRYTEVPNAFAAALGPGLGVTVIDANDDSGPTSSSPNDSMANHLWINQRNGTPWRNRYSHGETVVNGHNDGLASYS